MLRFLPNEIPDPHARPAIRDAHLGAFVLAMLATEVLSTVLNAQSYKLDGASLVWLPNGLLIGALVSSSYRRWPALLSIGIAIDIAMNLILGGSLFSSLCYSGFNLVEVVLAAALLHRALYPHADLTQPSQLRAFLLYGVALAPSVAALCASTFLFAHRHIPYSSSWRFWYAADVLGVATVAPLYLSFHQSHRFSRRSWKEVLLLTTLLCLACFVVFGISPLQLLWIVMLLLLLLGVRAGFNASALGLLLVISIGGYLTILGRGSLGAGAAHPLGARLFLFQCFIATCMVALYVTEVAMTSNRATQAGLVRSEARYRSLADELEGRVADRTCALEREIAEREVIQHHLIHAKLLAEEANHAKSAFLANMSHELRTPLNAILGYSEMLEEDAAAAGQDASAEDLRRIQQAGRHLLDIVNDVLDLAKIEAGRIELFPEPTSVASIVQDIATTIEPLARQHSNHLALDIALTDAVILTDAVKFKQCLLNLLSNACKFTTAGRITLRVHHDTTQHLLLWQVEDTGIGIAEKDQQRLFRAFTQVDNSNSRRHDGTGLGLVISQRLIHMMGGEIRLHSRPGEGSTFTIALPDSCLVAAPALAT